MHKISNTPLCVPLYTNINHHILSCLTDTTTNVEHVYNITKTTALQNGSKTTYCTLRVLLNTYLQRRSDLFVDGTVNVNDTDLCAFKLAAWSSSFSLLLASYISVSLTSSCKQTKQYFVCISIFYGQLMLWTGLSIKAGLTVLIYDKIQDKYCEQISIYIIYTL